MSERTELEVLRDAVDALMAEVDAEVAQQPAHEQWAYRKRLERSAFDNFITGAYRELVAYYQSARPSPRNLI